MKEIKFLLTTLSPAEVESNCSVTTVLVPDLEFTPVSLTSNRVSSTTWSITVSFQLLTLALPPGPWTWIFPSPPTVLVLISSITSLPVQFVSQAFHIVGANPVWGSTFKVLDANSRVSA